MNIKITKDNLATLQSIKEKVNIRTLSDLEFYNNVSNLTEEEQVILNKYHVVVIIH